MDGSGQQALRATCARAKTFDAIQQQPTIGFGGTQARVGRVGGVAPPEVVTHGVAQPARLLFGAAIGQHTRELQMLERQQVRE